MKKAASTPYTTALLITTSISYKRYFNTAIPIEATRKINEICQIRLAAEAASVEYRRDHATVVSRTGAAAAANHFSCRRSSPLDRKNLTTVEPTHTTNDAMRPASTMGSTAVAAGVKGSAQWRVACIIRLRVKPANATTVNHAAGRHRRDARRPVGKIRNTNAKPAMGRAPPQFPNHPARRPSGSEPGATISARSA